MFRKIIGLIALITVLGSADVFAQEQDSMFTQKSVIDYYEPNPQSTEEVTTFLKGIDDYLFQYDPEKIPEAFSGVSLKNDTVFPLNPKEVEGLTVKEWFKKTTEANDIIEVLDWHFASPEILGGQNLAYTFEEVFLYDHLKDFADAVESGVNKILLIETYNHNMADYEKFNDPNTEILLEDPFLDEMLTLVVTKDMSVNPVYVERPDILKLYKKMLLKAKENGVLVLPREDVNYYPKDENFYVSTVYKYPVLGEDKKGRPIIDLKNKQLLSSTAFVEWYHSKFRNNNMIKNTMSYREKYAVNIDGKIVYPKMIALTGAAHFYDYYPKLHSSLSEELEGKGLNVTTLNIKAGFEKEPRIFSPGISSDAVIQVYLKDSQRN